MHAEVYFTLTDTERTRRTEKHVFKFMKNQTFYGMNDIEVTRVKCKNLLQM